MILKKGKFKIALLLVFLICSLFFINPSAKKERSKIHSLQLSKSTVVNGDTERVDYFDSDGQISIAGDRGYATIITTKTENSRLERYYDDRGEPINRYNGYYAALYEYDDKGNNIRITYLDLDDKPMIMANGYAIEEKVYNENRQIVSVRYYDAAREPILTPLYGYGKNNEYNGDGNNSRITYVDASGAPMMTGQGFASVVRSFYISGGVENGKVESEFYFDEKGEPVSLSLGQYGLHKGYDEYGRESLLIYLGADGDPITTNKGYTTVIRTYHANGNVATEQYYDLEGKPYALSEGKYGIKAVESRMEYLDQNGEAILNLKNLLYNHSWIAIPTAIIMIVLSAATGKKWNVLFLALNIGAICYLTLLFREKNGTSDLHFFWHYRKLFTDSEARADIIKNIWLFIPLGFILYRLYPKKTILVFPIAFSILIESIQMLFGLGFCELDDVISNSLGGWIGFCVGKLSTGIKERIIRRGQGESSKPGSGKDPGSNLQIGN